MEENIKAEEVKVEVVEEKKKGLSKKKLLAIGGTIVGLGLAALLVLRKGKDDQEDNHVQFVDTTYEPVSNDSEVVE